MIRTYFKQAWVIIKENRLISGISIAGTALSISAIMLIVLTFQVNYGNYAPESNRYRTLYIPCMSATSKDGFTNNGMMSERVLRECLYTLKTPAVVSGATYNYPIRLSMPGEKISFSFKGKYTDELFFKVFDFQFIDGKPFSKADLTSAIRQVVISKEVALRLFATPLAAGRMFQMKHVNYTVCGVVENVSKAASEAYAQVWMPYTLNKKLVEQNPNNSEGTTGELKAYLLASSTSDFDKIRAELDQTVSRFNKSLKEHKISFIHSPYTIIESMYGNDGYSDGNFKSWITTTGSLIGFLLLLPALNMIGIAMTQYRKRRSEIGLRKSFGAHFRILFHQILIENFLISFIGGVIGIIISFVLFVVCKSFLISDAELTMEMLFQPIVFIAALFFIFLINLLTASIPAWRTARLPIVKAINDID